MPQHQTYSDVMKMLKRRYDGGYTPGGLSIEHIAQLKVQNTYDTHLDIAKAMASHCFSAIGHGF